MSNETLDNVMVLYHKHCSDGLAAAWSFRCKYPNGEFVAVMHDGSASPDVSGKNVFIVDFCYSPEILFEMNAKANSLLVLDHHKSAMERCGFDSRSTILGGDVCFIGTRTAASHIRALALAGMNDELANDYPDVAKEQIDLAILTRFDMKRSGAGIAWDYCFPEFSGNKRPWLINYTEDRDLWNWALPDSREINSAIQSYPLTFESLDNLMDMPIDTLKLEGSAILRSHSNMTNEICGKAQEMEIAGYMVPVVNTAALQSEVCNQLCRNKPFAAAWFENEAGDRVYSLRSSPEGVDVSVVAATFGGGGHKSAAGYRIKKDA